ncbi:MAG: hypothetical protein CL886_00985 [Dehalococcoidia bacterium]|nr:hypothetical protein [Dehalococcoidia bacterium]|tara:strand:- start:8369 stop:9199 length:831 start_codon:yes stop_codon:yes gene_type:complete
MIFIQEEHDMSNHKINIGNVELISVSDGTGDREPTFVFPDSDLAIWQSEFSELLDDNNHLHPRYGSVIIRSEGKLILVDTGLQAPGGTLIKELNNNGVAPDQIDLVVMTHLHPDHVGWNFSNGLPTFPNARYLAPKSDWEYWVHPDIYKDAEHIVNQVLPLENLNLIDLMADEYSITSEIMTVATPGHTPGHVSLLITSRGEQGFVLGDVAHNPAQAHYTDWNPVFDIQPELSRQTRHNILDRLESENLMVSAGHFPTPGFGKFIRSGNRRIWQGV